MTAHFSPARPAPPPGAAPVGTLESLDGVQALCVMLWRDWCADDDGRTRVARLFARTLGPASAPALRAWSEFGAALTEAPRRPLMRHSADCPCVGADEAIVAQVLTLAATAEREDAMMTLSLLVPANRLLPVLHAAERAGLHVIRAALAMGRRGDGG